MSRSMEYAENVAQRMDAEGHTDRAVRFVERMDIAGSTQFWGVPYLLELIVILEERVDALEAEVRRGRDA